MNGIIEINAGGKKYTLRFGMLSLEILAKQQELNPSTSAIKMLMDLVYSGLYNASILKGEQAKSYEEVAGIVEELLDEDKGQVNEIWKCFEESKAGEKMLNGIKKKLEEIEK